MSFMEYYQEIQDVAFYLGYNSKQVKLFINDIREYYQEGKTTEECIRDVF